jgi:cation:H+ antiporter
MFELVLPVILLLLGIIILVFSSNKTVDHSVVLACNWSVPPIIIGLVLVSIGTDFPEIINSVISSSLDLGNINVGTSIGSAFAQLTLILGIIALSLRRFEVNKKEVFIIGVSILFASILSFLLILDSYISRLDGLFLITSWVLTVLIIRRIAKKDFSCPPRRANEFKRSGYNVLMVILGFIGVAIGTYLVIDSILEITRILNISEFIASFFIASIGTSLPELTVTLTALRKGQQELAIGDIMGSSLLDASISIGIGPLLFPTSIPGGPVIATWIYTIVSVLIVTLLLSLKGRVDKKVGIICLSLYLFSYSLLYLS